MRLSSVKMQRESKIELSMTSMIDVVFLLLIFFMTTASFVKTERNLDSAIKVTQRSANQTASDLEPAIVVVTRGATGFVYKLGKRETTSDLELTDLLKQFENKIDGAFVRVGDEAPFRMAAGAIQACKSAGFTSVSYVPLESTE
jgi:biopolymer transport protein ExbD